MQNTNTAYTFFLGGGFSILAYLIGGIDNLIASLATIMAVDFISGVMVAGKLGYEQSVRVKQTGKAEVKVGISSNKAFMGLMKKTSMILAVIVAVRMDSLMGNDGYFMRNAMIMLFIGMEGISFSENLGKLGVKLPALFVNTFEQLTKEKNPMPPNNDNEE